MSLTKEDLQAISDLIEDRLEKGFDKQGKWINERFDEQDKKFEAIDNRFEAIDKRFEAIDNRFDEQDKKFEAIERRFESQEKLMNMRFDDQERWINKKFEEQKNEFKEMLIDNNLLIAEHVQRVVSGSEERLMKELDSIKRVTADNCYEIARLKIKVS